MPHFLSLGNFKPKLTDVKLTINLAPPMINHRWYFLIQKEGETKWSSLTGSSFPEGHYRLAAKSDRSNLEVDVRLIHTAIVPEDNSSKTSNQHYSCRLNSQGFVLLSPLIYFAPGHWQIRCLPSVFAAMSGASGQVSLNFEITAKEQEEVITNVPEMPASIKSFWETELPEVPPPPELNLTPHKLIDLEDESLTPELENIIHGHYQTDTTFTTPKLITTEITSVVNSDTNLDINLETHSEIILDNDPTPASSNINSSKTDLEKPNINFLSLEKLPLNLTAKLPDRSTIADSEAVNLEKTEQVSSRKKESTYIIQLHDLKSHTSVTVDIAILEDEDQIPLNLQLPETKLRKPLLLMAKSFSPVLPPKLPIAAKNQRNQGLQFTKFEPKEKAS